MALFLGGGTLGRVKLTSHEDRVGREGVPIPCDIFFMMPGFLNFSPSSGSGQIFVLSKVPCHTFYSIFSTC